MSVITKLPKEPDITSVEIVLLIAGGLTADGKIMPSALPGQIVIVVERIVGKDLRVRIGANIVGAAEGSGGGSTNALSGETDILLRSKRYADCLIAG